MFLRLNRLYYHRTKRALEAVKEAIIHSDGDDALTETQNGSGPDPISDPPENLNEEHNDLSPPVLQLTHQKDIRGSELTNTQDTVVVPTSRFKRKVGQHVMLTDDQGLEVGKGTIHLARGVWFGNNLEDLKLCVVDVHEIQVHKTTQLPHPSDAGSTYSMAELILRRMRILWDSSRLLLLQQ